jgi:hypothetical protein
VKVGDLVRTKRGRIFNSDSNESIQCIRATICNYELGIVLKIYHSVWYSEACVYCPTTRLTYWRDVKELQYV